MEMYRKNELFIKEVAKQLLPYLVQGFWGNDDQEEEAADDLLKDELKELYEDHGAVVLDLDELPDDWDQE